jgi:hypothetical protein
MSIWLILTSFDISASSITDPLVSRIHLKVHCHTFSADSCGSLPSLVYVTDKSIHGTFIIGPDGFIVHRIPEGKPYLLRRGDVLSLGGGNSRCILHLSQTSRPISTIERQQRFESQACCASEWS